MFTLPDLPYPYHALEPYIDEETMRIHHTKHHQAYIDNLNTALDTQPNLAGMPVEELLQNLAKVPDVLRTKVRNHGGGHANHSFFWQIMAPSQTSGTSREPQGEFIIALNNTFGSLLVFQETFTKTALGRFGSGWAWLVYANGKLEIADTPNQDSPLLNLQTPLLGLDVWEHAYYLKYQNRRGDYIKAWWQVVNWAEVEKRFKGAKITS